MTNKSSPFPMIKLLRNTHLESLHFGSAIVVGPDSSILIKWGDPDQIIFPRSAMKIIQAIPLVESRAASAFKLKAEQLAIACSSHQGSPFQTNIIKKWLRGIGLKEENLKCGIQPPSDRVERQKLIAEGKKPSVIHNNCSGKHTGFLTVVKNSKFDYDYTNVDHPLQQKIRTVLEDLSGEEINTYGVDGCSAPNFRCSLSGLAYAMYSLTNQRHLGKIRSESVEKILLAMQSHPLLVAGVGRACSELMMATSSKAIVKTGAEGVFVCVLPEKRIGVALKILDGSTRASEAAITLILVRLGVLSKDHPIVSKRLFSQVRNWNGNLTGHVGPTECFWDSGKRII